MDKTDMKNSSAQTTFVVTVMYARKFYARDSMLLNERCCLPVRFTRNFN